MKKIGLVIWALLLPIFFFAEDGNALKAEKKYKVGLLIMATGEYNAIALKMIESARQYFLLQHERTFFVFTDSPIAEANDIFRVEQTRLGRPFDSLKRFHVYYAHKDLFEEMDYIYSIDAGMMFVDEVGDEILSDLVGTRHWGFMDKPGVYCNNKKSTAYVSKEERKHYCCGAFYGGKRSEVLKLLIQNISDVDEDLKKNIRPKWGSEAYLNRYFIDHQPTRFLSPAYSYPQGFTIPYCEPKLIVLLDLSVKQFKTSVEENQREKIKMRKNV